jgi:hypothetical protein
MAEVLLRRELAATDSHLGASGARCPCYVRVGDHDLPPERASELRDTGVAFRPGSGWVEGRGLSVRIGLPRTRWNGNFDVDVGFDCKAARCKQSARWVMRYDGSRWRVIQRSG